MEKKIMKSKFELDDSLPLNKILKLYNLAIIVRSVFEEDEKYYPQIFLDACLNYKNAAIWANWCFKRNQH